MRFSTLLSGLACASVAASIPTTTTVEDIFELPDRDLTGLAVPIGSVNEADAVKRELSQRDARGSPVCFNPHSMGGNIHHLAYVIGNIDRDGAWHRVNRRRCRRIGCSSGVGVAVCNDRHDLDWSIHASLIWEYVRRIRADCHFYNIEIAGQQFDTGGFNVIASRMSCGGSGDWAVGQNIPQ